VNVYEGLVDTSHPTVAKLTNSYIPFTKSYVLMRPSNRPPAPIIYQVTPIDIRM